MSKRGWGRAAVAALAAVLVATTPGAAAVAPAARRDGADAVIARYQAEIPRLLAERHIPGAAVVLVDGDRVVWQQGFGATDRDGRTPVTTATLFSVQSMSKLFTATAVMRAVQAGRLDLDVPITRYLPGFTVHSAFEPHPERRITLRMLLSHTAGFTHEAPIGNNYDPEPGDFDAHVRSISDTWLRFPAGSGYAYSNVGIDLAGYLLQRVTGEPFPAVMRDSVLSPLGMRHSTFDWARVRATADRAVGHSAGPVRPPVDVPMTASGGLWAGAADLARFLRFQLTDGRLDGRTVLDPALIREMRTVPAPHAGAPAGYALGVARTRWPAGRNLDLFNHNGGGYGFRADLWWLPQWRLGIALLINSDRDDVPDGLALRILQDLATEPGSRYRDRMLSLPAQSDVVEPDGNLLAPPDLAARVSAVAIPASPEQSARWAGYPQWYRTGRPGAMNPVQPPSRFHVEAGVPYFDAAEDGTPVPHRLTEFQPGLFLSGDGETLDLRAPSPRWRGLDLNPVADGPRAAQWVLLAVAAMVAAGWLVTAAVRVLRRRTRRASPGGRAGRALTVAVAVPAAITALATAAAIRAVPGLVDVGYLGRLAWPLPLRLAFHLPLAVTVLAALLAVLVAAGAAGRWWKPRVRPEDAALTVALAALTIQLAAWHLIG